MQGWRISMEDAHAAILDLQPEAKGKAFEPAGPDTRLSYFGVYDGHGGEKVAQFAGENIHKIVAKQDGFAKGDIEQALKDGFLATDRAILNGMTLSTKHHALLSSHRSTVRRRGFRMYRFCWCDIKREDLGRRCSPDPPPLRDLHVIGKCWRLSLCSGRQGQSQASVIRSQTSKRRYEAR